jgi:hypothetical protein
VIPLGPRVTEEIKWRAYVVLGTLSHCRAVARLSAEELAEVQALVGCPLSETAETGRVLLELSETDLATLAEHVDNPWDHQAMRRIATTLRRDGLKRVQSMALRAALLGRVRRDLADH